ncbi:MAG: hypothetical protein QJR00_07070, partial [Bacillota bacterium]|nr:hypothetical protein [Bacillota bacterium]
AKFVWAATTPGVTFVREPLNAYPEVAKALDWIFVFVGLALFLLGLQMAIRTIRSYRESMAMGTGEPQAAPGD